jgi:hypothetical protein
MTSPRKTIFLRFARASAAVFIAGAAVFVAGPDFLGLVPDDYDWVVIGVVAPALLAIEKFLRDGGDATS